MRCSAFAFLRGTCHLFYDDLPKSKLLRNAPLVWVCGDLHLENFGSYKGDNRLVYFDLNDFDEAVLAPCTWDLLRFLTSVLVGAGTLRLTKSQARSLCGRFLDAYVAAIEDGKARWVEPETAQGMVNELLASLHTRKRKAFLNSRTVRAGGERKIRVDAKRALPVTPARRARVKAIMRTFAKRQPNPGFYRLIDVARRVAGTGSLGVERYVLLVEGKGSPDGNYLLDLKQALPSSLTPRLAWKQPKWKSEAHRVVTLQHRVQSISMAFLTPLVIGKTSYVLRGLQPSEDRVALDQWNGDFARLEAVVATMGQLVAWGQLRSSARGGSATVDELIDFWAKRDRMRRLVSLALECRAQVERDWQDYCRGYDGGALPRFEAAGKGAKRHAP
jgi:uncharacterized protein (DUF2252 family)